MMMRRFLLLATLAIALAAPVLAQNAEPTAAQPTLPTEKLTIVTHDGRTLKFDVEIASTTEQQTIGLMFRPNVAPGTGMLFDWHGVRPSDMWMRNTVAPLDMLFIDSDGKIHHIAENTVPQSMAIIPSNGPVRGTLEIAAGTAEKLDIRVGDVVHETIFGNAP